MELLRTKITTGKPDVISLVFPECTLEEVRKSYRDFYDNVYDRSIYFKDNFKGKRPSTEQEYKQINSALCEHSKKTYFTDPSFYEVFPADRCVPKEYQSAMEFIRGFNNEESVIESIAEQFCSYLWKKEIPLAQHLKLTFDDDLQYRLNELESSIMQQEEE